MSTSESAVTLRLQFLDYLFGGQEGFLCLATANPEAPETTFKHHYFEYPAGQELAAAFIQQQSPHKNVWFCVSLLSEQRPIKENCLPGNFIWADLDHVTPSDLENKHVSCSCAVLTSPGSYQAYWRLENNIPSDVREDFAKKMTYYTGADKGGWARNKLMRVPYTPNHKYPNKPEVEITFAYETKCPVDIFLGLPEHVDPEDIRIPDMPGIDKLPDPDNVIYKYAYVLHNTAFAPLYNEDPHETEDWSKRMWRLLNLLIEAGLSPEETFSLGLQAKCNKYARDNRPSSYLWKEVIKAKAINTRAVATFGDFKPLSMPQLVDHNLKFTNFVTEYSDWGAKATDAVPEYHQLCGFMILSALMASGLKLEASFGKLVPNIWGMILGDSTLTRKTTAMELAMSFVKEVDDDLICATDGSPEGLITTLSNRPDRVSIYFKDEVTGFFASINNKNYLADMPEILTKMYDVPSHYPRTLRKEVIIVTNPYFIFFGGGIRDKVYQLINEDYVLSGFLPRFLIVTGQADLTKLRSTGPPNEETIEGRKKITEQVFKLHRAYNTSVSIPIGSSGQIIELPKEVEVKLTKSAWDIFARFETQLIEEASSSPQSMIALPTFTRLAFSLLKMAMLLAASRGPSKSNVVTVEDYDILQCGWYIQRWGRHSIDLINNAGITKDERLNDRVLAAITRTPGITKTALMQGHKVSSKVMAEIIQTLQERGLITINKQGKGLVFWPAT